MVYVRASIDVPTKFYCDRPLGQMSGSASIGCFQFVDASEEYGNACGIVVEICGLAAPDEFLLLHVRAPYT